MTVWYFNLTWSLIPLLAGGMLVGPVAAVGLYGVVRRGTTSVGTSGQVVLVGAILMIVALIWIRAATLLFAVFYGLQPFPGFSGLLIQMFTTPQGLLLLLVGSGVGGLFAAFTFAISAFSIPMLVDRPIDAFSAMALSFNAVTHNFTLAVLWGAVLTGMALVSIMTGLLGIVLVFPWLGYATWHAYCDLFEVPNDV
ncbi:MAG: DUF2189 domain-containing protein [Marinovum sp.]|nr:DUF2189 domain-containing protein [Marinovum sp.]